MEDPRRLDVSQERTTSRARTIQVVKRLFPTRTNAKGQDIEDILMQNEERDLMWIVEIDTNLQQATVYTVDLKTGDTIRGTTFHQRISDKLVVGTQAPYPYKRFDEFKPETIPAGFSIVDRMIEEIRRMGEPR